MKSGSNTPTPGMRERSGRHCEGRDRKATNTTAETAEAGLFQTSYKACTDTQCTAHPLLQGFFSAYRANPSGFADVFSEGVTSKTRDWENFGSGPGRDFQRLDQGMPGLRRRIRRARPAPSSQTLGTGHPLRGRIPPGVQHDAAQSPAGD